MRPASRVGLVVDRRALAASAAAIRRCRAVADHPRAPVVRGGGRPARVGGGAGAARSAAGRTERAAPAGAAPRSTGPRPRPPCSAGSAAAARPRPHAGTARACGRGPSLAPLAGDRNNGPGAFAAVDVQVDPPASRAPPSPTRAPPARRVGRSTPTRRLIDTHEGPSFTRGARGRAGVLRGACVVFRLLSPTQIPVKPRSASLSTGRAHPPARAPAAATGGSHESPGAPAAKHSLLDPTRCGQSTVDSRTWRFQRRFAAPSSSSMSADISVHRRNQGVDCADDHTDLCGSSCAAGSAPDAPEPGGGAGDASGRTVTNSRP